MEDKEYFSQERAKYINQIKDEDISELSDEFFRKFKFIQGIMYLLYQASLNDFEMNYNVQLTYLINEAEEMLLNLYDLMNIVLTRPAFQPLYEIKENDLELENNS